MPTFRAINPRAINGRGIVHNSVIAPKANAAAPPIKTESRAPSEHSLSSNEQFATDPSDTDPSALGTPDTADTDQLSDQFSDQSSRNANANAAKDTSAPAQLEIDPICQAKTPCVAGSGDHRKTVSHIFGRNKACTRRIPDDCWVKWCRKHYQRYTYRCPQNSVWHKKQLELVRKQLDRFEEGTNISSWNVALRKKEQAKLDEENAAIAAGLISLAPRDPAPGSNTTTSITPSNTTAPKPAPSQVWERFLVPHLGLNKSYTEVREVCDIIGTEFSTPAFKARGNKAKVFPGLEFLPVFPDAKVKAAPNKTANNKTTTSTATNKTTNNKTTAPIARGTKRKAVDTVDADGADAADSAKRVRSGKAKTV